MSEVQSDQETTPEGDSTTPATPVTVPSVAEAGPGVELDMILDIPVVLSIELGRTKMSIEQLLKLSEGSVVELKRPVDAPMDVLVNGTLVAKGDVVVVDETLGIRLTEVASPMERVDSSGDRE